MRDVEFPIDSATLPLEEVTGVLTEVADIVEREPDSAVLLIGHASRIGPGGDGRELSRERVESVRNALVELGVPDDLIRTDSRGARNPESPTDAGERLPENRRLEIRILDVAAGVAN